MHTLAVALNISKQRCTRLASDSLKLPCCMLFGTATVARLRPNPSAFFAFATWLSPNSNVLPRFLIELRR